MLTGRRGVGGRGGVGGGGGWGVKTDHALNLTRQGT